MALGIRELLIAAFLLVMSIMVTIFACTLVTEKNAFPLLPMLFYIFAPVPFFLCGVKKQAGFMDGGGSEMMTNLSHFFTGMFAAGGPAMTMVLWHTDTIGWPAMLLSLGSAVLLVASVCVIHFGHHGVRSDDSGF